MPSSNYSSFESSDIDSSVGDHSEPGAISHSNKHGLYRHGKPNWRGRNAIQRAMRASLAWLAAFGAVLSIVGGALIATGSVASASTTVNLGNCTFKSPVNGNSYTSSNTKIAAFPTKAGGSVGISCSNMNPGSSGYGDAIAAGESSMATAIAKCNGATCSGTSSPTIEGIALNEADVTAGDALCNTITGSCSSSESGTYSEPSPWKAGGQQTEPIIGQIAWGAGDPNASCPPSQQWVNIGLVGCGIGVTDTNGDVFGLVVDQYPSQPTPQAPKIELNGSTSTASVSAGGSVSVADQPCTPSSSTVCPYFWGDPLSTVPNNGSSLDGATLPGASLYIELCPSSGSCINIPDSASSPTVKVNPAVYNVTSAPCYISSLSSNQEGCTDSGNTGSFKGSFTSYPTIGGSFTVPSSTPAGTYTVEILEQNGLGIATGNSTNSSYPNYIEATASLTVGSSSSTTPTISSINPTSGSTAGGTSVTITGTNFTSSATVKFGSTAATSVKYNSATSLTAISPAESAGTVQVTVTTSTGTSNGVSYTYTSSTSTTPTITSITPDSSPLAGGGTATIIGTNLFAASAVNFGSTAAINVKAVSSTEITVTIPAASSPGLVDVTVHASGQTSAGAGFMYVTSQIPYTPVTPYRIADTRCSASPQPAFCSAENLPTVNQSLSSPPAGGSVTVQVTGTGSGSDSVPSGAQSVVVTVTAIAGLTAKNGYLTVYPAGTNPPTASSLNYAPGMAIPNLVTATLGSGGAIDILSSSANVNIVVDVEGYYMPSTSTSTSTNKFTPLPLPVRLLDTRCEGALAGSSYCTGLNLPTVNQLTAPGADSYIKVEVAGLNSIPVSATAVSLVVTAAGPSSGGYLTVFPAGSSTTPPETSNVNFHKGIPSADSVTVAVGTGGFIYVYNSAGTPTNVIVDINGYFSPNGYTLTPSSPVRICDTRSLSPGDVVSGVSEQCANSGTALDPSTSSTDPITLQVTGIAGIPSSAKVVVANITVVNTITGSGYLTAWAAGATQPTTSNINWGKGQVMPNMVISALNSSGQMEIYCSSTANVIVDVVGWYS